MRRMLCFAPTAQRFIEAQPWFASVPAALQERLRGEVLSTQGDKGAVMMPAGSPVQGWHAVLSGLVMLQSPASKGRSSAFIGVPDGEWFGEGSAMKPEPRKYNVVALRPTTLLCLPLPLFDVLRDTHLAFNQFLVLHLNMRLGQAMTIIEAGRTQSTEHRVALYLSRLFWRSTRRLNLTQDRRLEHHARPFARLERHFRTGRRQAPRQPQRSDARGPAPGPDRRRRLSA
jgi:CRP-like cAMP-binding protein